jgi:hypothetical protein
LILKVSGSLVEPLFRADNGEAEESGLSDEPLSLAERAKGSKWSME